MKTILVDDEPQALNSMKKMLEKWNGPEIEFEIVGTFHQSHSALEFAEREAVEIAFLDIGMPEMNGMVLAELLMNLHPHIHIVFVTAYHEYAIEAFELNALDYVLKPVQRKRLAKTLQRIADDSSSGRTNSRDERLPLLCCMRNLHYIDGDGKTCDFRWRTQKVQELFAYLVMQRQKTVGKQTLLDLLWPDYDLDRSSTQLHTAIYQIRKVLKEIGWDLRINFKDEGYRLILGNLLLDVEEWEKKVLQAPPVSIESLEYHQQLLSEYKGDFLQEHSYVWAEIEQERIRHIWLEYINKIAEWMHSSGQHIQALSLYQSIRERCPFIEDGYFGLMKVHADLGHNVDVVKQYEMLENYLWEEYGIEPNQKVAEWYTRWRKRSLSRS